MQNSLISELAHCNYGRIEPQRCKSLCGSLIYGVYLLRHSGARCFSFFHTAPRTMPHARCSPRSGPRGRTSYAAQDLAHLSTMWPSGDI
nr:MAG TPA: hypothetical protein [Caudoviricetes sp.]